MKQRFIAVTTLITSVVVLMTIIFSAATCNWDLGRFFESAFGNAGIGVGGMGLWMWICSLRYIVTGQPMEQTYDEDDARPTDMYGNHFSGAVVTSGPFVGQPYELYGGWSEDM